MMNKYKMAVSCGRGMGIVKNTSKTWGDIVKKLSTHVELDDKEKAGFFVGGEFSSEKRKDEFEGANDADGNPFTLTPDEIADAEQKMMEEA